MTIHPILMSDPMIGQTVSHYRIVRKVGGGGMGVVYEAEDLELDRHVALKFLPEALANDHEVLERFRREARAASALNHPHICTIHHIGDHEGQPYLILELLKGETLAERIAGEPLPIDEVVKYAGHLADALDTAHSAGIVHRDIKPANLFITERGDLKVLDFGLAKKSYGDVAAETSAPTVGVSGPLTTPGTTMGTIHYMSPEQVRAEELDARTDIFSAGVVIYEMATGQLPFDGSAPGVILSEILNRQPTPPSEINREISPALEAVIGKALIKDQDERYQSALDMMTDLGELPISRESWIAPPSTDTAAPAGVFETTDVTPPADSAVAAQPSRWLWVAIAVIGVLAAGSIWLNLRSGEPVAETDSVVTEAANRAIVVLPFENQGEEADDDFANGVTNEISARLGSIPGLSVISSASAARYADKTMREIGDELGATHVVTGSIRWLEGDDGGARVRIDPELILVADGTSLWSETIDRRVADIFAAQGEIAGVIASELGIGLDSTLQDSLAETLTDVPEAYEAYLQGKVERNSGADGRYVRAIQHFERAVELDPQFAEAWAQLARNKATAYRTGHIKDPEIPDQVRSDADRAVALKPEAAESQLALGAYYYEIQSDFERAAEIMELVAERQPNDAEIAAALGAVYRRLGRVDDAIASFARAVRLEPDRADLWSHWGATHGAQRRWSEMDPKFRKAIELDPDETFAYSALAEVTIARGGTVDEAKAILRTSPTFTGLDPHWLRLRRYERDFEGLARDLLRPEADLFAMFRRGVALQELGKDAEADAIFDQIVQILTPMISGEPNNESDAQVAVLLALAHAAEGNVEEAHRYTDIMLSFRSNDRFQQPRNRILGAAKAYAWLGEADRAMDVIEEAISGPAELGGAWGWGASNAGFRLDPDWDNLRGNPRFEAMIAE